PVTQEAEQALDVFVADGAAQTHAVDVAHRHEYGRGVRDDPEMEKPAGGAAQTHAVDVARRRESGRVVRDDPEMVKPAGGAENGLVFNPLDDPESMVRVNDLVADFKCHASPCLGADTVGVT